MITEGSHGVLGTSLQTLRGWYPLEALHFPIRTVAQLDRKGRVWGSAVRSSTPRARSPWRPAPRTTHSRTGTPSRPSAYVFARSRWAHGREALERGLVMEDTRARDALRALSQPGGRPSFPRSSPVDDAAFAADAAVLGEADVVRVRRRLDELEQRIAILESHPTARAERRLRGLARRALGRSS